jgi:hypothetical protein
MRGVDEHEVRRGPAYLCARHHQAEVRRLGVSAACFKAVIHGCSQTGPVAAQTHFDTAVHVAGNHGKLPWLSVIQAPVAAQRST